MKVRILTAAGCTLAGLAMANVAIAQGWPTIGVNDLEPCRQQIAQFHQMEFAYYRGQMDRYCPTTSQYYYAPNCTTYQNMLSESSRKNDFVWYVEGNGSCEASDYPCFGVTLLNEPLSGEEEARWVSIFESNVAERGTTIRPGMDFYDAGHVVNNCTTAIWLQKYRAWRNGGPSPTPPQPQPQYQPQPQPVAARPVYANDAAFNTRLQTSQPDQLVSLAQELLSTGQIDLARLARNALLARYPDSPLVPTMVDLLVKAATSSPAPSPVAPSPAAPSPAAPALVAQPAASVPYTPATQAASPRFTITDSASLIAAFAEAGYGLQPTSASNKLVDPQNRFNAFYLGCDAGPCSGIQLLAEYSFQTLPSHDRIVQWNRDKLFGRAYLRGNMVDFDMVIVIPSNGIEASALKEQIALYLDATSLFYAFVQQR